MKLNNILKIALIAPFLVACGESDEFDGNAGGIATFSGTIDGVSTRVDNDAWDEDDAIGVSVVTAGSATTGSNVKYITAKGDGTFAAASTEITYGDKNSVEFAAYYPYDKNLPEDGIIKFTSASIRDYMFAKGSGKSTKPNVKFQFSHVMSQVVLNLTAGTGVDLSGTIGLSLGNIIQDGSFNTLTGEVALTSGATASSVSMSIPQSTRTSLNLALNFLPQDLETLNLELTINGTTYVATLSLPEVDGKQGLLAGRSVSYNITVNNSSLNASNGSIVGWIKDTGSFASGMLGTHMADEAQLYDLALSDGSFVSVWPEGVSRTESLSDENLEILQTNIGKINSDNDLSANVVGVVYWTGNPTTDDGLLRTDYPNCSHGLILALKDMHTTYVQWMNGSNTDYSVSDAIDNWTSDLKPNSDNTIFIGYDETKTSDKGDTEKLNKALGYNNTKLLRAYNYYCSYYEHKVHPIEYLDLFAAKSAAPKGSSGWYLPSPKELVLTLEDNKSIEFYNGKNATGQFKNIQGILKALGDNASEMGNFYWSSSECKKNKWNGSETVISSDCAWLVGLNSKNCGYVINNGKDINDYVRAVCAF